MLLSAQIQRRQSEIREKLSGLAANAQPTTEQRTEMDTLDAEYRSNEARYRAALIAEDTERRDAGKTLETRAGSEWATLVQGFELRQVALNLDEGAALSGQTAEVVAELRGKGGYRGVPVPLEVLERRAGETVAANLPNPSDVRPLIDRLFPGSVAGAMGASFVNIDSGSSEWPVVTDGVSVAWAAAELGNVANSAAFKTASRGVKPEHTLGAQMKISRLALKQTAGIEQAITRDLQNAIAVELDRVVFQGSGTSGEPLGVIPGASIYGITSTAVGGAASYATFRKEAVEFMQANAASGPGAIRVLIRPELWDALDNKQWASGSGASDYDRLVQRFGSVVQSANVLAAPTGTPAASNALLTCTAGIAPVFVASWGAVDLIRDPYSDAQSGGLRLTGLVTMDVTVPRGTGLRILTGLE